MKKALDGFKQAPHAWYGWIDGFLVSLGFTKSDAYPNLYYKVVNDEPLILVLYVDDLFLTGNEKLIADIFVTSECIHLYILYIVFH